MKTLYLLLLFILSFNLYGQINYFPGDYNPPYGTNEPVSEPETLKEEVSPVYHPQPVDPYGYYGGGYNYAPAINYGNAPYSNFQHQGQAFPHTQPNFPQAGQPFNYGQGSQPSFPQPVQPFNYGQGYQQPFPQPVQPFNYGQGNQPPTPQAVQPFNYGSP